MGDGVRDGRRLLQKLKTTEKNLDLLHHRLEKHRPSRRHRPITPGQDRLGRGPRQPIIVKNVGDLKQFEENYHYLIIFDHVALAEPLGQVGPLGWALLAEMKPMHLRSGDGGDRGGARARSAGLGLAAAAARSLPRRTRTRGTTSPGHMPMAHCTSTSSCSAPRQLSALSAVVSLRGIGELCRASGEAKFRGSPTNAKAVRT